MVHFNNSFPSCTYTYPDANTYTNSYTYSYTNTNSYTNSFSKVL
jgi:hypothetical protein